MIPTPINLIYDTVKAVTSVHAKQMCVFRLFTQNKSVFFVCSRKTNVCFSSVHAKQKCVFRLFTQNKCVFFFCSRKTKVCFSSVHAKQMCVFLDRLQHNAFIYTYNSAYNYSLPFESSKCSLQCFKGGIMFDKYPSF